MLATQYLSEDTQTVLRAAFSPAFNISEQSIRPVVNLFNKIKTELPVDKFRLLVSLLLQIDFDPVPLENKYDILLIETRIVHLLQDYPDLALEVTSLLHDVSHQRDHYLNWLEHTRTRTDFGPDQHDNVANNNVDARELDAEHGPTSNQTKGKESAERLRYKDARSTSMEFEMSRQLYPAVPASLRSSLHATNQEEPDTRKTVHSHGTSDKTPQIRDPSEVAMMPVEEKKNSGGTRAAHSILTDGGERRLDQANASDSADDLITSRLNDNEETIYSPEICAKDSDVNSDPHAENREGVSTRKRVRRLGAREEDMLLRKVGSHCIMIGVKERNGATQNTDNTQSGEETSDGNPNTSRREDEDEMVLVIDNERSKERHKKRKRNPTGRKRANMVKVTALCRADAWLDKQEKRKQDKTKKGKTTDPDTCGDEGTEILMRKSQGGIVDDFEAVSTMTSEYLTTASDSVSGDESSTVDVCSLIDSQDPFADDCSGKTSDAIDIHASDSSSENMRYDSRGQKSTRSPALHLSVYQRSHCAVSSEDSDTQQGNSGSSLTPTVEPRLGSLGHFPSSSSGTILGKYDPNFPFTTAATVAAMSSRMDVCAFPEDATVADCDNQTPYSDQDTASSQRSVDVGTECNTVKCPSQVEENSFLSRLLRSPRPLTKTVAAEKKKSEKRRLRQPKKERKAKKPRRSRRLRRKQSRDGDESFHQDGDKHVYTTGKRHTCCS
ncbi:uncharacterized protein [Diadema setosum]|uniref:uncharacterized protein n=1 Tax=Diadema setosum TaxID=31175 RepID=UPI003B3BCF30